MRSERSSSSTPGCMSAQRHPLAASLRSPALAALSSLLLLVLGCSGTPEPGASPTPPSPTPAQATPSPAIDADGDGSSAAQDCNDADPSVYPGATERCDEQDNNCDGNTDEGVSSLWYADLDQDGFGSETAPVSACAAPAGYVVAAGDCNDADPFVHANAARICDGRDHDCDGEPDLVQTYFFDADEDGFGDRDAAQDWCSPPPGWVIPEGDCADEDGMRHPGAEDLPGDGVDGDCGGTEGPEPCVGLGVSCITSIQAAIEGAAPNTIIWVGPGTYAEHDLRFSGKAVAVVATHGPRLTQLQARGADENAAVVFDGGETSSSLLRGLRITGAAHGGILITESSPTLERLEVVENRAPGGAGLRLDRASPTLSGLLVARNQAQDGFAGGGGLYLFQSHPTLIDSVIRDNQSAGEGGGMLLSASNPTLERVHILANQSAARGGGISLFQSSPVLNNLRVSDNRAEDGAGLYLFESSPQLLQVALVGNDALRHGGGIYLDQAATRPRITNCFFGWNAGYHLYNASTASPAAPTLRYNAFYTPFGPASNLGSIDASNLNVAPAFLRLSPDGDSDNDDLTLRSSSPLIDAGDPALKDLDGSRADIGLFGGAHSSPEPWQDQDQDSLPDGWERAQGSDPEVPDATNDEDLDGLSTAEEYVSGTDPWRSDSDGDGASDGTEHAAASDPLDWYAQPEIPGPAIARVPIDFPSVSQAVLHMQLEGEILVAPGSYSDALYVAHRRLVLGALDPLLGAQLEGVGGSVLRALSAELELSDLEFEGGLSPRGGGLYLSQTTALLQSVSVRASRAEGEQAQGGGAYLLESGVTWLGGTISGNQAAGPDAQGGGLYAEGGSLSGTDLELSFNRAGDGGLEPGSGGGAYLAYATVELIRAQVLSNEASMQGGGLYIKGKSVKLNNCRVLSNRVLGSAVGGAGLYLLDAAPVVTYTTIEANLAEGSTSAQGGGLYARNSKPTFAYVYLAGNQADSGGAMALAGADAVIFYSVLVNNRATLGAGIFFAGSTGLTQMFNSILAYNVGGNVLAADPTALVLLSSYSDFYNPTGEPNHNISGLETYNYMLEPGLLQYDAQSRPTSPRLSVNSMLINQGDPYAKDLDGSVADCGLYGGMDGGGWDQDGDGFSSWFWPGDFSAAPVGVDPSRYDCDDDDPLVNGAAGCQL